MRNTRSGINVVKNLNYGLFTLVLSASAFGMQTTSIAHQDIAGLVGHNGKDRWLVHLEQQTGESVANLQTAIEGERRRWNLRVRRGNQTLNMSVSG